MPKLVITILVLLLPALALAQEAESEELINVFGKEIETNKFDFSNEFTVEVNRRRSKFSRIHLERKKDTEFKESDDKTKKRFLNAVSSFLEIGPLVSRSTKRMFNGSLIEWNWYENAFLKTSFDEHNKRNRLDKLEINVLENKFIKVEEVHKVANFPGIYSVTDSGGNEVWTSQAGLTFGAELFIQSKYPELKRFIEKEMSKAKCAEIEKIDKAFRSGNAILEFGTIEVSTIKGRMQGFLGEQVFGAVQLISDKEIFRCTPNDEGYFELREIPDGKYELRLTGPVYMTHIVQVVVSASAESAIFVIEMQAAN